MQKKTYKYIYIYSQYCEKKEIFFKTFFPKATKNQSGRLRNQRHLNSEFLGTELLPFRILPIFTNSKWRNRSVIFPISFAADARWIGEWFNRRSGFAEPPYLQRKLNSTPFGCRENEQKRNRKENREIERERKNISNAENGKMVRAEAAPPCDSESGDRHWLAAESSSPCHCRNDE